MAKKPEPKPLFSLKQDFIDSLNHATDQMMLLTQAVSTALDAGMVDDRIADKLRERLAAAERALGL